MRSSNLSFSELESRFHLDIQLLPAKGSKDFFHFTIYILKIDKTNKNSKILLPYNEKRNISYVEWFTLINSNETNNYQKELSGERRLFGILRTVTVERNAGRYQSIIMLRAGDVEKNPGPDELTLVSQNCRGLKNNIKIKQLINSIGILPNGNNKIVALQETHLEDSLLKYMWTGNFALTPSIGSKGGVITLVSNNINIKEQHNVDNEGHVLLMELQSTNEILTLIVANLHSPCAHNSEKINFFKKIIDQISYLQQNNDNCEIIIMGDFNTTFWPNERINTSRSKKEIEIADKLNSLMEDFNLTDSWSKHDRTMTWRHGEKMSRIDRIKWSKTIELDVVNIHADWTLTSSDHAAVIVNLKRPKTQRKFCKITRIDTSFMNNIKLRHKFSTEIDIRMEQLRDTNMNPHSKLEYLKMSIRSIAIDIATNYKKELDLEFNEIKSQLSFWQSTFENASEPSYQNMARDNLDRLSAKRDKYLEEKGKYLSDRSKCKWYQEGERSSRYFLNINRSKSNKSEMTELLVDGSMTIDQDQINSQVEKFYKNLYEKGDTKKVNESMIDDFLAGLPIVESEGIECVNKPMTVGELLTTLKSCSDSAPGPDGIPYSLIKLTWKHFGQLLLDSWEYSKITGTLAQSHETSYLRLIPKEGKDIRELKNWRPITLSNCDFKIITKSLSTRLAQAIANIITPNQTAYIKNRQITDNLHIMLYSTEKSTDSMIVSLDAEKAFDSIEHWYIKKILEKIGLRSFVETFDLLYRNQGVNIILNGNNAGKYNIKNGVKQGDALSCILFILGVEPLLRNINDDRNITEVRINGIAVPKALAYADDIACIIHPDSNSLQRIFDHYDKLTSISGLKLNADKTEIINIGGPSEFNVTYNSKDVHINVQDKIKVNGIILSYDNDLARKLNIDTMLKAVHTQLNSWSKRYLSLLGKIVIFKTFGLSQILYKLSVLEINRSEEKQLTNIIYKFLWNRNMDANRAPDRIRRSILATPVKELGFGMIDYKEVIKSLRIKNMLRVLNMETSPLSTIIKANITNSIIKLKTTNKIRESIDAPLKDIQIKWLHSLRLEELKDSDLLLGIISREYVGNLVLPKYKKNRLIRTHRNDTIGELLLTTGANNVIKKLDHEVVRIIERNLTKLQQPTPLKSNFEFLPVKCKLLHWSKISSKKIRDDKPREPNTPKLLNSIDISENKKLGAKLSTLTNSRLKTVLLRCLHGDVYSKDRMFRFGMTDDRMCPRCHEIETTQHMLLECAYVVKLWEYVTKITGIKVSSMNEVLGISAMHDKVTLTLHAETLRRLMSIERPVIEPRSLLISIVKHLSILEKGVTKYQTELMLHHIENNLT